MAVPRVTRTQAPHDVFPGLTKEDYDLARRRHATVFPSSLDIAAQFIAHGQGQLQYDHEVVDAGDDGSTWEFKAPVQPFINRRLKRNTEPALSPAQEIARRYRAGLKLDLAGELDSASSTSTGTSTTSTIGSSSPLSSSPDLSTLVNSNDAESHWNDSASIDDESNQWSVPTSPIAEPVLKHRPSRANAVAKHRKEAMEEMHKFGSTEDSPLVCPRSGCRDTLANVNALTYHLHLHDINLDEVHECTHCGTCFETRRALHHHACPARSRSAPSSPIFATFQHVLSKITSLS